MANPKFNVGEVVILQSNKSPHLNGEYTVLAIVYNGGTYQGYNCDFNRPFVYDIGLNPPGKKPHLAVEEVLRKRHQPGDMSYSQLIKSLDRPVKHNQLGDA
jgi:hypothetical protein